MKKKGFTLIELLAVIVILAIIALIAVPIVLNIISDTKNSAIIRGADFYIDAVELSIAQAILDGGTIDGEYTVNSSGNICKGEDCIEVEVQGDTPDSGSTIVITDGQISSVSLNYANKTVIKENNELVFVDSDVNTIPEPVSFEEDSWSTIIANVKTGNTDAYIVGAEKEITLTSNVEGVSGTYTVRIANKSVEDEYDVCSDDTASQTACGFVIEFVDIITEHVMESDPIYVEIDGSSTATVDGGWPASDLREFITPVEGIEGSGTIYNALPEEIRNAIIDTRVLSGSTYAASPEPPTVFPYTSIDKLYILTQIEIYNNSFGESGGTTRQLDYYADLISTGSAVSSAAIKYLDGTATAWWLRSPHVLYTSFSAVTESGSAYGGGDADRAFGVAPAFRLG